VKERSHIAESAKVTGRKGMTGVLLPVNFSQAQVTLLDIPDSPSSCGPYYASLGLRFPNWLYCSYLAHVCVRYIVVAALVILRELKGALRAYGAEDL